MKFVIFVLLILSNCESTCVLTEGPASIYDKNMIYDKKINNNLRPYLLRKICYTSSISCGMKGLVWDVDKWGE